MFNIAIEQIFSKRTRTWIAAIFNLICLQKSGYYRIKIVFSTGRFIFFKLWTAGTEKYPPEGTRTFSYSSQAAYSHLTGQLGLRPQTGPPSDAASLLVPTENELTFPLGDIFLSRQGYTSLMKDRRIVLRGGSFFYTIGNGLVRPGFPRRRGARLL